MGGGASKAKKAQAAASQDSSQEADSQAGAAGAASSSSPKSTTDASKEAKEDRRQQRMRRRSSFHFGDDSVVVPPPEPTPAEKEAMLRAAMKDAVGAYRLRRSVYTSLPATAYAGNPDEDMLEVNPLSLGLSSAQLEVINSQQAGSAVLATPADKESGSTHWYRPATVRFDTNQPGHDSPHQNFFKDGLKDKAEDEYSWIGTAAQTKKASVLGADHTDVTKRLRVMAAKLALQKSRIYEVQATHVEMPETDGFKREKRFAISIDQDAANQEVYATKKTTMRLVEDARQVRSEVDEFKESQGKHGGKSGAYKVEAVVVPRQNSKPE